MYSYRDVRRGSANSGACACGAPGKVECAANDPQSHSPKIRRSKRAEVDVSCNFPSITCFVVMARPVSKPHVNTPRAHAQRYDDTLCSPAVPARGPSSSLLPCSRGTVRVRVRHIPYCTGIGGRRTVRTRTNYASGVPPYRTRTGTSTSPSFQQHIPTAHRMHDAASSH